MKNCLSLFVVFPLLLILGSSFNVVKGDETVCDETLNTNYELALGLLSICADNSYSILPLCDCLSEINGTFAAVYAFNASCYNTINSTLANELEGAIDEIAGADFSSCYSCYPLLNQSYTNILEFDNCMDTTDVSLICNCNAYKLPTYYSIVNASNACESVPDATYGGSDIIPDFFFNSEDDYDENYQALEYNCGTTQCNQTILNTALNISNTYLTCSSFEGIDLNYGQLCTKNCSLYPLASQLAKLDATYNCSASFIAFSNEVWNDEVQPIVELATTYYPFLCGSQCGTTLSNFFVAGSYFDNCYLNQDIAKVCTLCKTNATQAYTLYNNLSSVCSNDDPTYIEVQTLGFSITDDLLQFESQCASASSTPTTTTSTPTPTPTTTSTPTTTHTTTSTPTTTTSKTPTGSSDTQKGSFTSTLLIPFFNVCLLLILLVVLVW